MGENNELNCIINLFNLEAQVIHANNKREYIPIENILSYLYNQCDKEDINIIHFFGNEEYINGLISQQKQFIFGKERVIKVN